jgi:multidrug resistance efflux pump
MLVAAAIFVARYLQDQATYVSTENATISGALLQVGSLNSGQIASVGVDIGDSVKKDQSVAVVTLPSAISSAQGTAKLGFRGTDDLQVQVKSPSDGIVVARGSNPGDTVAAGQSLVTIVDPAKFWVQAQIEETKIGRVRVGQAVDVSVDALGQTIPGRVVAVGRASAATFSLMPASNASGNYTKVTQLVPVKIAIDYGQLPLTLGSSVEIKIRVAE